MKITIESWACDKCLKEFKDEDKVILITENLAYIREGNTYFRLNGEARKPRHYHLTCYKAYWKDYGEHNA